MDKTGADLSGQAFPRPVASIVAKEPKFKPQNFLPSKPSGTREDRQRLANDIIKYNPQPHLSMNSPSRLPGVSSFLDVSDRESIKLRPKSSSDLAEEARRFPPKAHSPLTLDDEIPQRAKSSRELKRQAVSSQLIKSNSTLLPNSQLPRNETEGEVRSSINATSEIGVDFDVDRAFRRNRLLPLSRDISN